MEAVSVEIAAIEFENGNMCMVGAENLETNLTNPSPYGNPNVNRNHFFPSTYWLKSQTRGF